MKPRSQPETSNSCGLLTVIVFPNLDAASSYGEPQYISVRKREFISVDFPRPLSPEILKGVCRGKIVSHHMTSKVSIFSILLIQAWQLTNRD